MTGAHTFVLAWLLCLRVCSITERGSRSLAHGQSLQQESTLAELAYLGGYWEVSVAKVQPNGKTQVIASRYDEKHNLKAEEHGNLRPGWHWEAGVGIAVLPSNRSSSRAGRDTSCCRHRARRRWRTEGRRGVASAWPPQPCSRNRAAQFLACGPLRSPCFALAYVLDAACPGARRQPATAAASAVKVRSEPDARFTCVTWLARRPSPQQSPTAGFEMPRLQEPRNCIPLREADRPVTCQEPSHTGGALKSGPGSLYEKSGPVSLI